MSFDCYGTLVDWNGGMTAALEQVVDGRAEALLRAYHTHEMRVEATDPHLSYREVLAEGLRRAAEQESVELAAGQEHVLADSWGSLPVFPEVPAALDELRQAGWRLAVLTNCDDDLFALTAPSLGVDLDEVVTAEQVRSYKPRLTHFEQFARRSGAHPETWVHVANSWVLDMTAAARLGLPRVWVDRDRSGHDPSLATRVVSDLSGIAAVVEDAAIAPSRSN